MTDRCGCGVVVRRRPDDPWVVFRKIAVALRSVRSEWHGDVVLYLGLLDARALDEESSRPHGSDFFAVSTIQVGDTATMLGVRVVVAEMDRGWFFVRVPR